MKDDKLRHLLSTRDIMRRAAKELNDIARNEKLPGGSQQAASFLERSTTDIENAIEKLELLIGKSLHTDNLRDKEP